MPPTKNTTLGKALSHTKTDKRLDILKKLQEAGSISEAARRAGVSYKAAWQAIDVLSNLAGTPLVSKVVGGSGGGGAQLTEAGKQLLQASNDLELMKTQVVRKASKPAATDTSIKQMLGLRTTMRNQFPAQVSSIHKKGDSIRVEVSTKGASVFAARITAASAELFALHTGQQVQVLFKATAVAIQLPGSKADKGNAIHGIVVRKSRGRSSGEVSMLVEPGITIVGFADNLSEFTISDSAVAFIDESALVLALV